MDEMKRSMQNNLSETAWPATQYLWPLHPIFEWVNDKAGLLFGRGEAPLIGLPGILSTSEYIFVIAGTIPNRKSTPVVDEWFGLRYLNGKFVEELNMERVLERTGFGRNDVPNRNNLSLQRKNEAEVLLPQVVGEAKKVLARYCENYRNKVNPQINEEIDNLIELECRHKDYQISLFENERKKSEQERKVEQIFSQYSVWVKETLEIEDNPYLCVVAVLMGV